MSTSPASTCAGAVVVGMDGSDHSERALEWAASEATHQHRRLVLLHNAEVLPARQAMALSPMGGVDPAPIIDAVRDAAEAFLADRVGAARERWPDLDVQGVLTQHDPREALREASTQAHLLVLGSRGRGPIKSTLLGSVSTWVSKRSACPVAICRPPATPAPRHGVLVGVDGTRANAPAVEFAFRLAAERGGDLTVLHCVFEVGGVSRDLDLWEDEAQQLVAQSVAGLRERYPEVDAKLTVAVGLVDDTLAEASADYELLVLGRPQREESHLFHFSTTVAVLERAATTVVVVPNPPTG